MVAAGFVMLAFYFPLIGTLVTLPFSLLRLLLLCIGNGGGGGGGASKFWQNEFSLDEWGKRLETKICRLSFSF